MATDVGRDPSGQALVASDGAATHLHPSGFDPSRCQIRKYDAFSRQIMAGDFVVGLILQLANGRWLVEIDGERIGRWTERTPQAAFMRWRDAAIAMEAATAGETEGLDAKHDSAGRRHRTEQGGDS